MRDRIHSWLSPFALDDALRLHATEVLCRLPAPVLSDLMDDPAFSICDYDPTPGRVAEIPCAPPARNRPSRPVALKRTLARRPADFIRWVIAHELAHAHLRNAGRWPGEDPELAADALAEEWGFPRPALR